MLSLFSGTESERQRLVHAGQSLHDSLQGCISSTHTLLRILNQHLDTSVSLELVGGSVGVGENLEHLLRAAWDIYAAAEQTDRHVRKNASRDLYARMVSPHTSLQEKGAIVRDFHQATMGIFGSVGGPVVAVLLRNAGLPERLEAALQEVEASPVLHLPMDALRQSSEIARAVSACDACGGPAREMAAGPPENGPFSGTDVVQRLGGCLPGVLTGRRARSALAAAAGHLEEALRALAPACKSFQSAAAAAEVYMALITEQQPGTGEGPGQNPASVAH
ncbi:dihydroorotate oxidase [Platysternon megacephalum]|uniref:Dihydroorotate oxidase n=1 Tax=Platysternon megacephalum TaxID=55544 RepID=A0A4D9DJ40_9SAUR|nr:dihydroorotate oxidase [Platysternon megacephalum]